MKADLATKYDLRVPRYTSYPTAPHFTEAVDGAVYRRWLTELSPDLDLSLYFHIPYCDTLCWFCGCYTKIVRRYEPVARYLDMLLDEIDLVADTLGERFRARHLHWGGGSPTLIEETDWQRLIERIHARFDVGPDAEVAVEMDPRDTTKKYVNALASAGVNRASIGVQDFHPEVQKAINRIQPFDTTKRVVDWLRHQGISGINMDLMYGLPYQTTERVVETVEKAVRLEPDRVALFGYAHVPWMKTHQKLIKDETLPDFSERWQQSEAAANRLVELGYVRIGFDHFARPDDDLAVAHAEGRMHRNFQGYTTDTAPALLGFGASAIGSLPQGYVQNTQPLRTYREAVTFADFATERGVALSDDDRLRRDIIERLMCDMTVDLNALCKTHDMARETLNDGMKRMEPLTEDGIVEVNDGRVTLTAQGRPFVRLVAAAFDAYLNKGEKRHSKAV
ncbi:MAG: oxygen-independent coproporphyrinogen III oxidase [Rhodospirillales bacterium]|jgi:oxygen-independent coproporphyrinogen-3 oxidase|nr:oxygen-independent coproporphyrinogen III oxidase [Rhodospirillales bacterium]